MNLTRRRLMAASLTMVAIPLVARASSAEEPWILYRAAGKTDAEKEMHRANSRRTPYGSPMELKDHHGCVTWCEKGSDRYSDDFARVRVSAYRRSFTERPHAVAPDLLYRGSFNHREYIRVSEQRRQKGLRPLSEISPHLFPKLPVERP